MALFFAGRCSARGVALRYSQATQDINVKHSFLWSYNSAHTVSHSHDVPNSKTIDFWRRSRQPKKLPPLATWCLRFLEFFQFSCSNALTWLPIVVYESARMFAKYSMLIPGIFCTPRCTRATFYGNLGLQRGRLRGRPRLQFAWGECTGRWNITHRYYPSE